MGDKIDKSCGTLVVDWYGKPGEQLQPYRGGSRPVAVTLSRDSVPMVVPHEMSHDFYWLVSSPANRCKARISGSPLDHRWNGGSPLQYRQHHPC